MAKSTVFFHVDTSNSGGAGAADGGLCGRWAARGGARGRRQRRRQDHVDQIPRDDAGRVESLARVWERLSPVEWQGELCVGTGSERDQTTHIHRAWTQCMINIPHDLAVLLSGIPGFYSIIKQCSYHITTWRGTWYRKCCCLVVVHLRKSVVSR